MEYLHLFGYTAYAYLWRMDGAPRWPTQADLAFHDSKLAPRASTSPACCRASFPERLRQRAGSESLFTCWTPSSSGGPATESLAMRGLFWAPG